MLSIHAVRELFLQTLRELAELVTEDRSFGELEEAVQRLSGRLTLRLLEWVLAGIDERLMQERDPSRYECLDTRERVLDTPLGELQVKRRYYRDRATGQGVFLLDEALGLESRRRLSPRLEALCRRLATEMPYHRAAAVLRELTAGQAPARAMTVWRASQRAGRRLKEAAERLRRSVFVEGQVPEGRRRSAQLHAEADEVYLRGRGQPVVLKLGVAYEGKQAVGSNRQALRERRVVAGVMPGTAFWEQASAYWGTHWDLSAVQACYLGGDGAHWVKQGLQYFPRACYRLDPFHLRRALREALSPSEETYAQVCRAIEAGDWAGVESALRQALRGRRGPARERLLRLRGYLREHWDGIVASGEAPRLGAIEAEVFHVLARRMKRHGACWSERGADHLARLLSERVDPHWRAVLGGRPLQISPGVRQATRQAVQRVMRQLEEDPARWLRARIPALTGPHATKPWVQVLRDLAHVHAPVA
ncbi:ISLre2 family transposase [Thermaerobacter composti]|uniref:ISLre2 family transposase n=1 Tax=Thermaerobacter composti TaxID=554949 RepID=A0ABZ0QNA1_9FIRM|nr:ISLre2 family transposase [Thermaerobacter composti]WPD18972.1 ISLre2 family transposase [Thermaerobacter composti]